MIARFIQLIAEYLLDGLLDFLVVDTSIRYHLQALLLVRAEVPLAQDEVSKEAPTGLRLQDVQPLLPELSKRCLLAGEEVRDALSSITLTTKDSLIEGLFQPLSLRYSWASSMIRTMAW